MNLWEEFYVFHTFYKIGKAFIGMVIETLTVNSGMAFRVVLYVDN